MEDSLPNKTLGQRLRELRIKADLSLRELGEKLKDQESHIHVSAAFLSDIENGRRFPSDEMLERMANLFSADIHELKLCDPRGPTKEIQDLATMNPRYAFAFRRAVEFIQSSNMSPDVFVKRLENQNADPADPNQPTSSNPITNHPHQ